MRLLKPTLLSSTALLPPESVRTLGPAVSHCVLPSTRTECDKGGMAILRRTSARTTAAGLQEPTWWEWGPWVIQNATGTDGPDSKMPAPGAVFVSTPLAAASRTHDLARTRPRKRTHTCVGIHGRGCWCARVGLWVCRWHDCVCARVRLWLYVCGSVCLWA